MPFTMFQVIKWILFWFTIFWTPQLEVVSCYDIDGRFGSVICRKTETELLICCSIFGFPKCHGKQNILTSYSIEPKSKTSCLFNIEIAQWINFYGLFISLFALAQWPFRPYCKCLRAPAMSLLPSNERSMCVTIVTSFDLWSPYLE